MKILANVIRNHLRWPGSRQGMALGLVMVIVLAVSILGIGMMSASSMNAVGTSRYLASVKAFWVAEAGVQRFDKRAFGDNLVGFADNTTFNGGVGTTLQVTVFSNAVPIYAESVGTVQGISQKIRVKYSYLALAYKSAIYGANTTGSNWTFTLRGTNQPSSSGNINNATGPNAYRQVGGRDIVQGDIYINGDVKLYEQSVISNAPAPNSYNLKGDILATGTIGLFNAATNYGGRTNHVPINPPLDLTVMNYASNNTWDVAKEFRNRGIASGYLPSGHALRNVVRKDSGDNYYFEPSTGFVMGNATNALTPLNLGMNAVYYVDGHVWFENSGTMGFTYTGVATIVSTRNIHLGDNLTHATNSLLGLVALGSYDSSGHLQSNTGNIYFGDPNFGTLYSADAFMLAANNFYYNTDSSNVAGEPLTGFTVFGNYAAMNQVLVFRDWYTNSPGNVDAAWYDPSTNRWRDVLSNNILSTNKIFKHYQMIVKYDERIRRQSTQPPHLPGMQSFTADGIYGGIYDWSLNPNP